MTRARTAWEATRLGPALLGLAVAWTTLLAWSGMVARPQRYLVAALLIGAAIALAGAGLRALRAPTPAVPVVQLVVGLAGLNTMAAHGKSLLAIVPTRASVMDTWSQLASGAATLNTYSSPVQVDPLGTAVLLAACGLGVIWAVDVVALSLRRAVLAALPLLGALSVPVSILQEGLGLPVFVITALLYLRLVASEHAESRRPWGVRPPRGAAMSAFWQVSVAAVMIALLTAPLVPVSNLLQDGPGSGGGSGAGNFRMMSVNPFIGMRRDLIQKTHTPLIYARTDAADTGYLRTTTLDLFTSEQWRPRPRTLSSDNDANGTMPNAPGLRPGAPGTASSWTMTLERNFSTQWLPLPYPVLDVRIGPGWRYDESTLDVAFPRGRAETPLEYSFTAFSPQIDQNLLRAAVRAPDSIREPMTRLPDEFPAIIRQRAREVTAGATTDFDKAVALQNWFRNDGNFTYSLEQRGGSGLEMLARFVTDDRIGYCEQFAAAMAAMTRSLGIPTRIGVGFLDGERQPDGRVLYTSDDRHAWPEVYFSGQGWVRFEPTPADRAPQVPDYTQEQAESASPSPTPSARPTQAPSQAPQPAQDQPTEGMGIDVPWRPVVGVLAVLALLVAPASLRRWQRRRRLDAEDPVHLAEGAWAELGATALDLGLDWPEHRSPREQARRMTHQVNASAADLTSLESLLTEVERSRYAAPRAGVLTSAAPSRPAETVETVTSWRQAMSKARRTGGGWRDWRGWRARWWPRSLLRSRRRPPS